MGVGVYMNDMYSTCQSSLRDLNLRIGLVLFADSVVTCWAPCRDSPGFQDDRQGRAISSASGCPLVYFCQIVSHGPVTKQSQVNVGPYHLR